MLYVNYILVAIISLIILPVIAFLISPITFKAIAKDLRIPRILYYIILTILGMILYIRQYSLWYALNQNTIALFLIFVITLFYSAIFAIISNNVEDVEIDKISNKNRPLVLKTVNPKTYYIAGVICQIIALLTAYIIKIEIFVGILTISIGYYLYSCKPFRLKKFPFIAKLIIGLNSLTVAVCGFVLAGGEVYHFPIIWIVFILIPLSLSANFVDLKDIEGDKATGIKTLPVIFGETKAQFFISLCVLCSYIMAGVLLNLYWAWPLNIMLAILHIYFIYKKPYNEKPIFLVFLSGLIGLNILLFLSNSVF